MHNIALKLNVDKPTDLSVFNENIAARRYSSQGQFLAKIERFAFSGNNLRRLESSLAKSSVLSSRDQELKVWGYAEIIDSHHRAFTVGQGFYGWFPMSRYFIGSDYSVVADEYSLFSGSSTASTNLSGFDIFAQPEEYFAGEHFTSMVTASESEASRVLMTSRSHVFGGQPENADNAVYSFEEFVIPEIHLFLSPILKTVFALAETLRSENFKNADTLIFTGAASKSALALAFILKYWRTYTYKNKIPKIIGLTSTHHLNHVKKLDYFDDVFNYPNLREIQLSKGTLIDFTGNLQVLGMLHFYLKQKLGYVYSMSNLESTADEILAMSDAQNHLSLPEGEFFDGRDYYSAARANSDICNLVQRYQEHSVIVCEAFSNWLAPTLLSGPEDVRWAYRQLMAGKTDPRVAYLCQL